LVGISVLGLDALSSSSYGPESALTTLLPSGIRSIQLIGPITVAIVLLLLIVFFSYYQTLSAYPRGGGSYTVAKDNLGNNIGLVAASGLLIDYILNVAIAISAGVGAIVSAIPVLLPYTLEICLFLLAILTLVNLWGTREAGLTFFLPTYLFIICMILAISIGIYRSVSYDFKPIPVETPPHLPIYEGSVSIWLIIKSFASGCTAMTGVEAVSNGVPLFKSPSVKHAKVSLSLTIFFLILFLLGIAFISQSYMIGATLPGEYGYRSILSQIFASIYGNSPMYYMSISSVIIVLTLSANTSFAGFPRICLILARDHFLPSFFTKQNHNRVYSGGIFVLAVISALLLIIFEGITYHLIPLFAIGAFAAFTLSQTGMAVYWWKRRRDQGVLPSLLINLTGAIMTFITTLIIFVSKFTSGAWLILLAIPVIVFMLEREKITAKRNKIKKQK
jgi:amino acid transporter